MTLIAGPVWQYSQLHGSHAGPTAEVALGMWYSERRVPRTFKSGLGSRGDRHGKDKKGPGKATFLGILPLKVSFSGATAHHPQRHFCPERDCQGLPCWVAFPGALALHSTSCPPFSPLAITDSLRLLGDSMAFALGPGGLGVGDGSGWRELVSCTWRAS